jgi:hypothetical protein
MWLFFDQRRNYFTTSSTPKAVRCTPQVRRQLLEYRQPWLKLRLVRSIRNVALKIVVAGVTFAAVVRATLASEPTGEQIMRLATSKPQPHYPENARLAVQRVRGSLSYVSEDRLDW